MKGMRKIYDMLMCGAYAHARWEYETSMSILRNKKKLLSLRGCRFADEKMQGRNEA
jgi:hypothetical protein